MKKQRLSIADFSQKNSIQKSLQNIKGGTTENDLPTVIETEIDIIA